MRRLEIEPDEEAVLESISRDRTGRNQDLIDFIKLLDETEGPFTYMLDAPWGEGKTFFIKSVSLVLQELNPQIAELNERHAEIDVVLSQFNNTDVFFLPFYFNAWENDFADDPLMALLACMAVEFGRSGDLRKTNVSRKIASILDIGLKAYNLPLGLSDVCEAWTGQSLIDAYSGRVDMRSRVNELTEQATIEVANKLVIFIDELDRCRPDFAVRLLEQTKSLFSNENTILVISTDSSQLAKAMAGVYGPGFDGTRFLERFFDERLTMTQIDSFDFANDGKGVLESNKFDLLAKELLGSKQLTIRDAYRIKSKLNKARSYCLANSYDDIAHIIANCTVLPLLVFIEREDIDLFRKITRGSDYDALYEYGKHFEYFIQNIRDFLEWQGWVPGVDAEEEAAEESIEPFVHDLCVAIYGRRRKDEKFREAQRNLGGCAGFDSNVYERLQFD